LRQELPHAFGSAARAREELLSTNRTSKPFPTSFAASASFPRAARSSTCTGQAGNARLLPRLSQGRLVADVRTRSDRLARALDPDVAERAINAVRGHGTARDLDKEAVTRAKLVLLAGLVADARLGGGAG
jgi:hypothetical protein